MGLKVKSAEEKKRLFEIFAISFCTFLLLLISRLETRLFSLGEVISENREFFTTIIYFALINLNVILILILGFLLLRNISKLVVERKRGVLGSALKKKLVIVLIFFALAPTLILFYVTSHFITTSIDTWFSEKVQITIEKTKEAGSHIYNQDQKRLESLARLAIQRVSFLGEANLGVVYNSPLLDLQNLNDFDVEYGLNELRVYSESGDLLWSTNSNETTLPNVNVQKYAKDVLSLFDLDPTLRSHGRVVGYDGRDLVNGSAPIRDPLTQNLRGVIVTEVKFETQILKGLEQILEDFADLKPGAQLIRLSYMILIGVVVLLILFSATWLGFYVAKEITGPIQKLAVATREIALGNYNIRLKVPSDDEMGQLVKSFNRMTYDLREQKYVTEKTQDHLQRMNEELDHKRQYLEIILKHITAGVLSIDSEGKVSSINSAAENLLKVSGAHVRGVELEQAFHRKLLQDFWMPVQEELIEKGSFEGKIDLQIEGNEVSFLVNAVCLHDENGVEMGYIIVFDNALEKIRVQRVLAWREVARRMAHEINNPLTPLKLSAQRLDRRFRERFEGEDKQVFKTCMETVITQVDSLRDLINEFAKFSKLPNINTSLDNVSKILFEVSLMFKMSYPEIHFESNTIESTPELPIDREQIKRAFVNIFKNAIASLVNGRTGRIVSKCTYLADPKIVRIEISDNGCGIPNDLKERVLEPYFSTKSEGTGLGLAIVHQIISDHGGYLRLTDNKDYGSIVIVELPIS